MRTALPSGNSGGFKMQCCSLDGISAFCLPKTRNHHGACKWLKYVLSV